MGESKRLIDNFEVGMLPTLSMTQLHPRMMMHEHKFCIYDSIIDPILGATSCVYRYMCTNLDIDIP